MKGFPILFTLLIMISSVSCSHEAKQSDNPFFTQWDTPFGVPPFDEIKSEHYKPAFKEAIKRHNAQIDSIVKDVSKPNFENLILRLDNAGQMLSMVSSIFGTVSRADRNDELQKINEYITPLLSIHNDDIVLNSKLFNKIKAVYDNRVALGLDSLQMRLTDKIYKRYVRAGAELSDSDKNRLKEINAEIASLRVLFSSNIFDENKNYQMVLDSLDLTGLPTESKEAAALMAAQLGHTGKFVFQLNKPSMIPFLTFSQRRDLRETLYKAYLDKGNNNDQFDNKTTVNKIAGLRNERAKLLDYDSHAAYVLDDRMAKTPQNVYALLDELWTPALERAQSELDQMKAIMERQTGSSDFESWDWWYYANILGKEKYNLDQTQLKPYLSVQSVRDGIFSLCNRLYGVTFRPIMAPVYHKDCQVYQALDEDNSHLGILYMDYYTRDSKRQGAWCSAIRKQEYKNGEKIYPIVSIVCNFPKPSERVPSLLSMDDVSTFFHEFGHALNNLFSDVPYSGLYGYEYDMVELPSQIMENWALDPQVLRTYAFHHLNGTIMPENLIDKVSQSRLFNQGFATVEYLAAAYIDMDIYSIKEFEPIDVNGFEVDMLTNRRGLMTQIEPRYHYPYFLHIMDGGYDAGYYGYIWAEVLDKDAYRAFVESGDIFNRTIARRFRKEILEKRGSVDGMEQYVSFRGHEPSRVPLMVARGLMEEPETMPETELDLLEFEPEQEK